MKRILEIVGMILLSPFIALIWLKVKLDNATERLREKNGYFVRVVYDGGEGDGKRFSTREEAEAAVAEYCKLDTITVSMANGYNARRKVKGAYIL